MTRRLLFFVSLLSFAVAREAFSFNEPHVQVISNSMKSSIFEISNESGKVPVEFRAVHVRLELPNLETAIMDVTMLHDSRSKLFWWQADPVPAIQQGLDVSPSLPRDSVIFLTASKFVMFWNGWVSGDHILVRESNEHYSTLDEGEAHVLHALEGRRGDIEAGMFLHQYKEVRFEGLDRGFLYRKNVANLIGPKLREVTRAGNNWRIVEDGPNGGSAVIILSDTYEVVSTNVQPPPDPKLL